MTGFAVNRRLAGALADYLKNTPSFGPIISWFGNRITNTPFSSDE